MFLGFYNYLGHISLNFMTVLSRPIKQSFTFKDGHTFSLQPVQSWQETKMLTWCVFISGVLSTVLMLEVLKGKEQLWLLSFCSLAASKKTQYPRKTNYTLSGALGRTL